MSENTYVRHVQRPVNARDLPRDAGIGGEYVKYELHVQYTDIDCCGCGCEIERGSGRNCHTAIRVLDEICVVGMVDSYYYVTLTGEIFEGGAVGESGAAIPRGENQDRWLTVGVEVSSCVRLCVY